MQERGKASSKSGSLCRSGSKKGTWQSQLSKKNGVRKRTGYQPQAVDPGPGELSRRTVQAHKETHAESKDKVFLRWCCPPEEEEVNT